MATKNELAARAKHASLYWQQIAQDTASAALQLDAARVEHFDAWTPEQLTVLDDLRQAGRQLQEAAESILGEIAEHGKA